MADLLHEIAQSLIERFGAQPSEFRGELSLTIEAEHIIEVIRSLKSEFNIEMLEDETAVDYWPQEKPRFHVIYQFYSFKHNTRLCLRVHLDGNSPSLPSIEMIYPNANWLERELWDMFGIHFENHSDLRRILMPHDWEGHPLRKNFPLGYEEVQFTFNFNEIDLRKPYAKE